MTDDKTSKREGSSPQLTPEELIRGQRDLGLALNAAQDTQETLRICLEHAIAVSGMDCGSIYLVDQQTGDVSRVAHLGLPPGFTDEHDHCSAFSPRGRLLAEGVPVYTDHAALLERLEEPPPGPLLRALAAIPVLDRGRPIACLNVGSHELTEVPPFSRMALESLAAQMAGAMLRARATLDLQDSEARYHDIFHHSLNGIAVHELVTDEAGRPEDLVMVEVNPAFTELTGLRPDVVRGRRLTEVLPGIEDDPLIDTLGRVALTRQAQRFEQYVTPLDRHYSIVAFAPRPRRVVAVFTDVTEQRLAEAELQRHRTHLEDLVRERTAELMRSNADLEEFAYVASHDLQEPLRMVTSYVQLLRQRYGGKLDHDADDFIGYATDGAGRMRQLIQDLLLYSRVGRRKETLKPVDCRLALDKALGNLSQAIEERGVRVTIGELPRVMADETQLIQLWQNLLSNAIKFSDTSQPEVQVEARQDDAEDWVFSVRDNGLGLDSRFARRIFRVFQRLHTREEFPGTGIGLAVCKKIVDRHGGRIWVESVKREGATFHFTIPHPAP